MSRSPTVVRVAWVAKSTGPPGRLTQTHYKRVEDISRTLCGLRITGPIVASQGRGECKRCARAAR